MSQVQWNGKAFTQVLQNATLAGLKRAGLHLQRSQKQKLSVSGRRTLKRALAEVGASSHKVHISDPSDSIKGVVEVRTPQRKRYLDIHTLRKNKKGDYKVSTVHVPSNPGEAPRVQFGNLQKSVLMNVFESEMRVRIGVPKNTIYGFWLEVGTKKIKPRPWMLATLREQLPTLGRLAAGGA